MHPPVTGLEASVQRGVLQKEWGERSVPLGALCPFGDSWLLHKRDGCCSPWQQAESFSLGGGIRKEGGKELSLSPGLA